MTNLTLCIITKDRSEVLSRTLERLKQQNLLSNTLVIDGSNKTKSKKICKDFDISYCSQKSSGMTAARNEAIEHCDTEYIAFIDDDSFVSDTWFSTLQKEFEKDDVVGVTGKLEDEDIDIGGLSRKIRDFLFGGKTDFGEIREDGIINGDFFYDERKEVDHMPGCNMAYHVPTLKEVEGFDEKVDVGNSYREDTIASYKVGRKGKIIYNPGASVNHLALEEEGDHKKWMFYNPYLTRYFLEEYNVISGFPGRIRNALITFLRHIYFAATSLSKLDSSYIYYLWGEIMGIKDFLLRNQSPKKYV